MFRSLLLLLCVPTLAFAAPVPKDRPPNPMQWAYMGIRVESGSMRVSSTDEGTPAREAGILNNDEIVRVGNFTPRNFDEVAIYVFMFRPGSRMIIEVRRGGELLQVPLILGVRPEDAPLPTSILQRYFKQFGQELLPD